MATGFHYWWELQNTNVADSNLIRVYYNRYTVNGYETFLLSQYNNAKVVLSAGSNNKWDQLTNAYRSPNQAFPLTSTHPATIRIITLSELLPSNFSANAGDRLYIHKSWSANNNSINTADFYTILEAPATPDGDFTILPDSYRNGIVTGISGFSEQYATFWEDGFYIYGSYPENFNYFLRKGGYPDIPLNKSTFIYSNPLIDLSAYPANMRYGIKVSGLPVFSSLPVESDWDLYAVPNVYYSPNTLASTIPEPWTRFQSSYSAPKKLATLNMIKKSNLSVTFTPKFGPSGTIVTTTSNYNLMNVTDVFFRKITNFTNIGYQTANKISPKIFSFTNNETEYSYQFGFNYGGGAFYFEDTKASAFLNPPIIYEPADFKGWSAKVGNTIHIQGTNFKYLNSVKLNGITASFVLASTSAASLPALAQETITVTVPQGATTGPIELTNDAGSVTSQNNFYIQPAPTITSFTPSSGLSGSEVVITGTNFFGTFPGSGSAVQNVIFGGSGNANILEVSDTSIKVYAPAAASGKIKVFTSGGYAESTQTFTQTYPPSGSLKRIGLNQEALDLNTLTVYTGYQYYIVGGSLDTLISVKFKYTNNSTLYDAVFEKISANTAKVTIPFMNNTTNGGFIRMVLQNAYATSEQIISYQLAINHVNINYPTISTYQTTPNNNTTPVTTKIGTNAYFNNANAWEKTTDIYFAKPTTRKDGLTENSEWTKAIAGWFSNNGEWQQFWPSVENAAKKFYKFDWESAGITGLIDVIKVVPDYPNLYLLLANSPGVVAYGSNGEPNSKSIIAKVNMLNGTISFIDVKGARGTNSCHISDIYVSADSVYAVGYDYTNNHVPQSYGWNQVVNYGSNQISFFEPHVRYLRSIGDVIYPGITNPGDGYVGEAYLRKYYGYGITGSVLETVVKKYSKNLNLQFSRKISSVLGSNERMSTSNQINNYGYFQAFKGLSVDLFSIAYSSSNYVTHYLQDNGLHEPKITLFSGALYIIFPVVSCDGPAETSGLATGFPTKLSFVAKKLKPTNLTEYTGETQVRLISANSKPLTNSTDDLAYESVAQFEFFRGWPTNKKSGFTQYSVFADQQLNGNNKISFNDGFYWNSLQINPDIRNAFLARDGVFNYATIIGDLESGTGDDNKNGMFVGLYAKNDTFEIMCGTESESGKVATATDVQFSNINSFLENYSSLQPVYTATSFPTSAFTVTETLNDNGGTGFPMTQVCNA